MGRIGAYALEHRRAVVQGVAQDVHSGLFPRDQFAVEPDVLRRRYGHGSLRILSWIAARSSDGRLGGRACFRTPVPRLSHTRLATELDAVDDFEEGAHRRFDNIGADAGTPISAVIVLYVHDRLALRILALGHASQFEFPEADLDAGGGLDCLERSVDRPIAVGLSLKWLFTLAGQLDGCARGPGEPRDRVQPNECPGSCSAALQSQHERFDVAVEQFLLAIGERLEFLEHAIELHFIEFETEFLNALAKSMPATVFAEHEMGARKAHVLRPHDLVGRAVLQHAVLMDAGFVRKRIFTNHRLVARDRHAGDVRYQAARWVEPHRVDSRLEAEVALARAQRHHHFLERAVAGALADAVDRAFNLPRSRLHGTQAVGDRHAEIVVTVDRQDHPVDAGHGTTQVAEHFGKFLRHGVADGVRNVHGGGTRFNHRGHDVLQELELRPRGIFRGEFDIVGKGPCESHGFHRRSQDLLLRHVELELPVDRTRREKDMHTLARGGLERARRALDVLGIAAGKTRDDRTVNLARDRIDGFPVPA